MTGTAICPPRLRKHGANRPKVEGADVHHNPTPGPADQSYLYGHIWVTMSLAVRHPQWGPLALPLRVMLYVRRKTRATIPPWRRWPRFATIEQDFHDVKEVGGAGQQQVRNIWTNLAAYNLNLSRGRSPQKSFNGPKPSWHWPPDLNQFSESAG